jgi:hypothetical protein
MLFDTWADQGGLRQTQRSSSNSRSRLGWLIILWNSFGMLSDTG